MVKQIIFKASVKFCLDPITRGNDFCEFHRLVTKPYIALTCDNAIAVLGQGWNQAWLLF